MRRFNMFSHYWSRRQSLEELAAHLRDLYQACSRMCSKILAAAF